MFCRMCGVQIPDYSEVCPVCGEEQHMTAEMEKDKDKMAVKILKGAGKTIGKVGATILLGAGTVIVSVVSDEVGKGLQKKVKKTLKRVGGQKTPFEKARKVVKTWKKGRK